MDLILSKPFAKVINRVNISSHRVIIINTWFHFCFWSPKSPFLIAKIHIVAIDNFLTVDSFVFVDPKRFIDINQWTHDLAALLWTLSKLRCSICVEWLL